MNLELENTLSLLKIQNCERKVKMVLFPGIFISFTVIHCCIAPPQQHVTRSTTALIPSATSASPSVTSAPTPVVDQRKHSKHVNDFYRLYGWLKPGKSVSDSELPKAIRKIQRKMKEPVTGTFSDKMMSMMSGPRCGTEKPYNATDAEDDSGVERRYVLWGPKWAKTTLTWRFDSYSSDLPTARQQSTISTAFAQWMNYIPPNIVQTSNAKADIYIRFSPLGRDDTRYGFTSMVSDGTSLSSGNINVTFNDDYQWTDDRLFGYTAIHEIGHALGLSHSSVEAAVMFAYYDGSIRPVHPDDKMGIHSIYGWKTPMWNRIDSGAAITSMIQVTSHTATPSANDGLYQMRSSGQILRYSNGAWVVVDNNKDTAQITGANGNLYQRHYDGGTFRWTGSASNWQSLSTTDPNVIDIVAASDQLYSRRKGGWIARLSGSTWLTIEQPSTPGSRQIAITDNKTLWNLLANGYLVRSLWPHNAGQWAIVDNNARNIAIAAGGNEFYKLQSDGFVVWLDMDGPYWSAIEKAASVGIYAVGGLLYSRHGDGTLWRYTGTPEVWEMIESRSGMAVGVVGDRVGGVWGLSGAGEIWTLVS